MKILQYIGFHTKNNIKQIVYSNTFGTFLRYAPFSYAKYLLTNIQKQ